MLDEKWRVVRMDGVVSVVVVSPVPGDDTATARRASALAAALNRIYGSAAGH
jgi:hypothetical protein